MENRVSRSVRSFDRADSSFCRLAKATVKPIVPRGVSLVVRGFRDKERRKTTGAKTKDPIVPA